MAARTTRGLTPARKRRLMLGAALVTSSFVGGYARRAYANCIGTGGTYLCSGATTTTQLLTGAPLVVTTAPGFGIDTTASGGDALTLTGTDGLTFIDDNLSPIAGRESGIYARNNSSGALSITTTGTVTGEYAYGAGINAFNVSDTTDLTIAAADVSGGWGILGFNRGSGALSITAAGTVTGNAAYGDGIYARNFGTDLTIAAADVSGGWAGVDAINDGSGALSITATGTVTGEDSTDWQSAGIRAHNFGTDLTISAAYVSGARNGIYAINDGSGALAITTTGTVTGEGVYGDGISATNRGAGLTIAVVDVSGTSVGIDASNDGSGALSITATGTVAGFNGIRARNWYDTGTDLTIKVADVSGGGQGGEGIDVRNYGTGALAITATGTVTGAGRDGIDARNFGTDLTIEAADVSGGVFGITANNRGSGALSITATGTVMGGTDDGIYARNWSGTDLTIAVADVSGGWYGIHAYNIGSGTLAITASGTVTGEDRHGIYARNHGADLTIAAADVSGGGSGIDARNAGSGALSITATGTVTGEDRHGISAVNYGTDLTIAAAAVSGGSSGINAVNHGSGALSITASGTVRGADWGIWAFNDGTDLTIAAADVSGGWEGIAAINEGSGALAITASGTVTGEDGDGIRAFNFGTDLTIAAADVSGGRNGIYTENHGSGALAITASGTVIGGTNDGIYARNYGTDLTIAAADVSGGWEGIHARNEGSGALSITASGTVRGEDRHGIRARNYGTNLTIAAADVSGGWDGIDAGNFGSGALSITASGTARGTHWGIWAFNDGTDLTIAASDVSGGRDGIYAINRGSGALSTTASGTVTGEDGDGIRARNYGTDLTIAAVDVSGGRHGIMASGSDGGAVSVTTTGTVTGVNGEGINVVGRAGLTVNVVDVMGGQDGIEAQNLGSGMLSITAAGTVTGEFAGIYTIDEGSGQTIVAANVIGGETGIVAVSFHSDLTISAGNVSGGSRGIHARNVFFDSGAISITATGAVTGTEGDGIYAYARGAGLTIAAADVSGGRHGIHALNHGSGAVSITASGTVTGTYEDGIHALGYGTDLTIAAADVSGGRSGIYAKNNGSGALSITATGVVMSDSTSFRSAGIRAHNYGTDLMIQAADVSSESRGIYALNSGTGALTITTTGTVTGGIDDYYGRLFRSGIFAVNRGLGALSITARGTVAGHSGGIAAINYGSDLTIAAADAEGGRYGVAAAHRGTGLLLITTSGAVAGSDGSGIYAWNDSAANDSTTTVTVAAGSTVSGATAGVELHSATGRAATLVNAGSITGATGVLIADGPATISNTGGITGTAGPAIDLTGAVGPGTVNQHGGAITGDILLSPAADTVNITGGTIAGNILGQGSATLNFALGNGTFTFGAPFTISGMSSVNVNSGTAIIAGTIESDILIVNSGGRLGGTGTVGTTIVAAGGTIAPGTSPGTLTIAGDISFAAGSTFEADITPALDSDLIYASGTATIAGGTVDVVAAPGAYTPGSRWTILSADGGVTGTFDTLIVGAPIRNMPFVDLKLSYDDPNHVYLDLLRNAVAFCAVAKSSNQCSAGTGAESLGPGNQVYDAIVAIPDEDSARLAFDRLSGDIHASIRGVVLEDSRFVREAATARVRAAFGSVGAASQPVMAYGPGGAEAAPATTDRFAIWGQAFGSWGRWDSDGNASEFGRSVGGFFIGGDAALGDWRVGLLAGYSHASFDVDDRTSSGSSDNYHIGLYAGTQWGDLGLRLGAAHSWHEIETNRSIAFAGFAGRAGADYAARTIQTFGELGYKLDHGSSAFEPFANLAYVNLRTDRFTEDGGAAALSGQRSTTEAAFTTLGSRASTRFMLGGTEATLRGMAGWRHIFGDVTPSAVHTLAGGDAFVIGGVPLARNTAVIEAGVDANLSRAASLGLSYQGQFGGGTRQNSVNASLNIRF